MKTAIAQGDTARRRLLFWAAAIAGRHSGDFSDCPGRDAFVILVHGYLAVSRPREPG